MIFVSAKTVHTNINLLVNFVYIRDDNNFYPPTGRIKRRIMSFADRYGPWTLILGASEGTGRAFARKIAANGVPSILIARREAPLLALAKEIHAESGVECITATLDLAADDRGDEQQGVWQEVSGRAHKMGPAETPQDLADRPSRSRHPPSPSFRPILSGAQGAIMNER